MKMNILIVDDEPGIRTGVSKLLRYYKYIVYEAGNLHQARKILHDKPIDCVLLDLRLGEEDGLEFLGEIRGNDLQISVIVITGYGGIQNAVRCMKDGASNYITKPIDNELLLSILKREGKYWQSEKKNAAYKVQLADYLGNESLLYDSANPEISRILEKIEKIKDSPVPVLISGETGTGKEITAKHIHYNSERKSLPFVSVNCAAINENLLESELFGHEKGAFTGANQAKPGRFELAGNGTLFLDEIGDMSLAMQSKILRILQEGTYERVGGIKTLQASCRIIAATNKNLKDLIEKSLFREDLYYRLNLVEINLPPLRERKEDIPKFVELFIKQANEAYNKNVKTIDPEQLRKLIRYDWPGNIRQLKNIISNAVLLAESSNLVSLDAFDGCHDDEEELFIDTDLKTTVSKLTSQYEQKLIKFHLLQNAYNISKTAESLGIARKTLYQKLRQHQIVVTEG